MGRHSRTYEQARRKVDREREYSPHDAVRLIKGVKRAKFDESVEVHIRTGLNVRHADEQLRGTIALPHGLGKEVKVAVFAKADKVEYRTDRTAIVHMTVGKTSFPDEQLLDNYQAVIEELIRAKPSAAKGKYIRSVVMASTMGPGVKVDPTKTRDLVEAASAA